MDCRFKYFAKYVLKLEDRVGDKALLGSALHEVFELLAAPSKKNRQKFVDYTIKNGKLHKVITKLLYKICKKYKVLDLLDDATDLLITTLSYGFDLSCVIDVERHFTIPVSTNVAINGFIDKVRLVNDKILELSDYKSGQPMKPEDCESDIQPFFYLIAAKHLYPNKQYLFTFHFLKNHKSYTIFPKDNARLQRFQNFIIAQAMLMKNLSKENAKPCKSWKCGRMCNFQQARPSENYAGCPAFSMFKDE